MVAWNVSARLGNIERSDLEGSGLAMQTPVWQPGLTMLMDYGSDPFGCASRRISKNFPKSPCQLILRKWLRKQFGSWFKVAAVNDAVVCVS